MQEITNRKKERLSLAGQPHYSPSQHENAERRVGERAANQTSGFVQTHGVGICRGRYSPTLLEEWHAWDRLHVSENDPVDCFPEDQLFVVFVVANGGTDLEKFVPRSHNEAASILVQVWGAPDSLAALFLHFWCTRPERPCRASWPPLKSASGPLWQCFFAIHSIH